MTFDLSPSTYARNTRLETQQEIKEIEIQSDYHIDKLHEIKKSEFGWLELMGCFVAGPFFGGLIGLIIWIIFGDFLNSLSFTLDPLLSTIIISIAMGTIICLILFIYLKKDDDDKYKTAQRSIEKEREKAYKKAQEMRAECEQMIVEYESRFKAEAKKLSTDFVESMLTTKVADWMTEGFTKLINSANRKNYIETVSVPFIFSVYKDKITCDLGTFFFLLERCQELKSVLEQAALANAIASTIHLNIKMRYPKDISGTDITVHITYIYDHDYISVTLTYTAANSNYRPPQEWK